jgi:hypothetical protein
MNFKILKSLTVLAVFSISSIAFASGLEVEPYAGYGFLGTLGTSAQYNSKTNSTFTTLGFGLRALYKFDPGFYAGPDFSYQIGLSITEPSSPNSTNQSGNLMKLGVIAGYHLVPNTLRAWVGYNFIDGNTLSVSISGRSVIMTLNGMSYKFGLGYNIAQNLYLNAEYFIKSYGSATGSVSGAAVPAQTLTGANVINSNLLLISISAPLGWM